MVISLPLVSFVWSAQQCSSCSCLGFCWDCVSWSDWKTRVFKLLGVYPLSLEDLLGNASKHPSDLKIHSWTLFFWTLKLWWWKEEKAGRQHSTMGIFNVHASFRRCSFDQGGVNSSHVTSKGRRGILPKWLYFSESSLVKCLHSLRFTC